MKINNYAIVLVAAICLFSTNMNGNKALRFHPIKRVKNYIENSRFGEFCYGKKIYHTNERTNPTFPSKQAWYEKTWKEIFLGANSQVVYENKINENQKPIFSNHTDINPAKKQSVKTNFTKWYKESIMPKAKFTFIAGTGAGIIACLPGMDPMLQGSFLAGIAGLYGHTIIDTYNQKKKISKHFANIVKGEYHTAIYNLKLENSMNKFEDKLRDDIFLSKQFDEIRIEIEHSNIKTKVTFSQALDHTARKENIHQRDIDNLHNIIKAQN